MVINTLTLENKRAISLKRIALPVEHGSWGFLFEPLVASLAVAFSLTGMWIALMIIGAFLTRQPLKVLWSDWLAKRNLPQTEAALKFTLVFGTISLLGLVGSLYFGSFANFYPFLFIIPLAIYQIYCDASKKSRQLLPELTGAIAISSSAAVIALAGGWNLLNAYLLWAIFVARLIPSILYVRSRLRLEKGKDFLLVSVIAAHFIALGAIGMFAANGYASKLTFVMFGVLLIRAFWGLSPLRKKVKAMKIGVWEVIYGTMTALSVIIGYYLGI
ncbi:MAG: YwiC-like family protein [Pyrinomonadaceae bacterium]|nr:YwiC-like family protein [Pyrinomonadaceae bacterium]